MRKAYGDGGVGMKYLLGRSRNPRNVPASLPRRLAGWVVVGVAALLVPASVYAWQHASADKGNPDQPAQSNRSAANVSVSAGQHDTSGPVQAQLQVDTSSGQPADGSRNSTGHISVSVGGNTSATLNVNGHTTTLPPNSSIDQSVSSNDNSTNLNVTMNSSTAQDVSGSSAVSVHISNDSEGGQ